MFLIERLINFVDLKTRSGTFPKTKVTGNISRSLSVMHGLGPGGLRTVKVNAEGELAVDTGIDIGELANAIVDSAGQQLIRGIDLADCTLVERGLSEDTLWHISTGGEFNLILYNGWFSGTNKVEIEIKSGAGGDVTVFPIHSYSYVYVAPTSYFVASDKVWVTGDRIKITHAGGNERLTYAAYKLPE